MRLRQRGNTVAPLSQEPPLQLRRGWLNCGLWFRDFPLLASHMTNSLRKPKWLGVGGVRLGTKVEGALLRLLAGAICSCSRRCCCGCGDWIWFCAWAFRVGVSALESHGVLTHPIERLFLERHYHERVRTARFCLN
jgi:hypothetical protein